MIPHQTHTIHVRQFKCFINREKGCIRCICLRIIRYNIHVGSCTKIMSWRIGYTDCCPILLGELGCILNTKIQLIAVDLSRISTNQRIVIGIAISIGNILIVITPNICHISTHSQTLNRSPTDTKINLMKSTLTIISIGISSIIKL